MLQSLLPDFIIKGERKNKGSDNFSRFHKSKEDFSFFHEDSFTITREELMCGAALPVTRCEELEDVEDHYANILANE